MELYNEQDVRFVLTRYSSMVYRLAYARTGNTSDAEDICQEVFLTMAQKSPAFKTEDERKAWLIRLTITRANSLWRTDWKRKVSLGVEIVLPYEKSSDDNMVADALGKLSTHDRTLIHLHYFEGFRLEEIAHIVKRPPATIRTQICRARKRLKKILEKEQLDNETIY